MWLTVPISNRFLINVSFFLRYNIFRQGFEHCLSIKLFFGIRKYCFEYWNVEWKLRKQTSMKSDGYREKHKIWGMNGWNWKNRFLSQFVDFSSFVHVDGYIFTFPRKNKTRFSYSFINSVDLLKSQIYSLQSILISHI